MEEFNPQDFCRLILTAHVEEIQEKLIVIASQSENEILYAVTTEINDDFFHKNTSQALIKTIALMKAMINTPKQFKEYWPEYSVIFCDSILELAISSINALALCESEKLSRLVSSLDDEENDE